MKVEESIITRLQLILLLILIPAIIFGQGESSTPHTQSSAACGFPNYCAYTGQELSDPFQWNPHASSPAYGIPKVPNVGNLSRKYMDQSNREQTHGFRDTSYLNSSFTDASRIPYVYRCTDANTEPGRDPAGPAAQTFSPAIGNSGGGIAFGATAR